MFSTQNSQSQHVAHHNALVKAIAFVKPKYNNLIEKSVEAICSDFDNFKKTVEQSVKAYLGTIEHQFFRGAGKKRGKELQDSLTNAKDSTSVLLALNKAIQEGNEDEDSLKTILYKDINKCFCNNQADQFQKYPLEISYAQFLADVIKKAEQVLAQASEEKVVNKNANSGNK